MEEDIKKLIGEYQNVDIITLLRTFKKEGLENFIVIRKNKLENLIKGYRELEETIKIMENNYKVAISETIHKSKIQEKIEELERQFDFYAGREHAEWQDGEFDGEQCDDISLQIRILEELLEKRNRNVQVLSRN